MASMYNKIFTKILDSSIWLEPDATRIVWMTCIAAMDEDGFCAFAAPANLAHRANVTPNACMVALDTLEGPDVNSSDPDHEGRRLERVPGGWIVLNAMKYREMITRAVAREHTRIRVRKHRANKPPVTHATVTESLPTATCNASEAVSVSEARSESENVAAFAAPAPSAPTMPTHAGKQRPMHGYRRLRIFRWMLDDICGMLGSADFDLDAFLSRLDQSGDVLPANIWPWLKEQVSAAAASQGLLAPVVPQMSKRTQQLMAASAAFLKGGE